MSISVLMSVYKFEKPAFLDCALRSVWDDQTVKPYEIILTKDGPLMPELNTVIDNWKNKLGDTLKIVVNQENLGLTKSLNKGLKIATGSYIARMDSDDLSLPHRFEQQQRYMEAHPEIDVLGGGMQEIDEDGNPGYERQYPETSESIRKYIVKANPMAHPTVFIRRRIFENGITYDELYRKNQDLKLWFDLLARNYCLHNLRYPVLKFRRTAETYAKRSSRANLRDEFRIYTSGIRQLYGSLNWRIVYPIIRYCIKSMPMGFNKFVYKYLFKKKS